MELESVSVLLLGDDKVGKSTFLSRISKGAQSLSGETSICLLRDIDQPFVFELQFSRLKYRLEFYDTSSPETWRLLQPDVVIICYDISQRLSLVNMQRVWVKEFHTAFERSDVTPLVVLGLKRDLRSEEDPNGIIYPQEAYQAAQEMRADKYAECSAVTGELLKETFEDICTTAVATRKAEGGQSTGSCSAM